MNNLEQFSIIILNYFQAKQINLEYFNGIINFKWFKMTIVFLISILYNKNYNKIKIKVNYYNNILLFTNKVFKQF